MGIFDPWMQRPQGGLLDIDPVMLSIAGQLLDNGGPSTTPRSMMQGLPQAILMGQQAGTQRELQKAQMEDARAARGRRVTQEQARTRLGAMMQPTFQGVLGDGGEMQWTEQPRDESGLLAAFGDAYPEEMGGILGKMVSPEMGDVYEPSTNTYRYGPLTPGAMTKPGPQPKEQPEVVQLAQIANDPSRPPPERDAAQARINSLTKADLNPVELKELFSASDRHQAGEFAISSLKDALSYNDDAYEGWLAEQRVAVARNTGADPKGVEASTLFKSIMTGQALEALRATFGGNPTEGERKILLEIQSSLNMSRGERAKLIERAISMAEQHRESAAKRARDIQGGAYRGSGSAITPSVSPAAPAQPGGWSIRPAGQ